MLEYWVWRNEVYFKKDGSVQKLKYHLPFIPNIPIIHHSIIPMGYPMVITIPLVWNQSFALWAQIIYFSAGRFRGPDESGPVRGSRRQNGCATRRLNPAETRRSQWRRGLWENR